MTQALYRKWRPQSWEAVIGQDHVVHTLRHAIAAERVAHAYLFSGPRGTGKTTTARLLAKAMNCLNEDVSIRPCGQCDPCQAASQGRFLDLIEIDAASNTSVEDVRDLRDKINFSPNTGRYKIYIIDEVHMLSTAAFNALLKTLEEPPAHAIFILATTEFHKIPATVLSRCQSHEFRRIPVADIISVLKKIAKDEHIEIKPDALTLIARQSTGAMRDAISLLDQLASTGQTITLKLVQTVLGTATNQMVVELVEALVTRQSAAGLEKIHAALDSGSDPRQFARQIVNYLRDLLLIRMGYTEIDETAETRASMASHSQAFTTPALLEIIQAFNQASSSESRSPWQPSLPLEMAWVTAFEATIEPSRPAKSSPPGPSSQNVAPTKSSEAEQPTRPQKPAAAPAAGQAEQIQPADTSPPPAGGNELTLQRVEESWRKILDQVGQVSRSTQTALNSCKPYGIKDGVLYLGFNGDFSKKKMEEGDNIEITRRVLQQVLGMDVPLRCFVTRGERGKLPPEVEGDSMVAAVLRDLGGEIVDVQ